MKKLAFVLFAVVLFAAVSTGLVFAQSRGSSRDSARNSSRGNTQTGDLNTASAGINIGLLAFGLDAEYERVIMPRLNFGGLNTKLALAGELGFQTVIWLPIHYFDVRARLYPWSGIFFADLGLGYAWVLGGLISAFMVSPQIGWKIDIGGKGKWLVMPSAAYCYFFLNGASPDAVGAIIKMNVRLAYSF